MTKVIAAALLLALAGCANRAIPANQGSDRPDWLPIQPERYERLPAPEQWNLAARPDATGSG